MFMIRTYSTGSPLSFTVAEAQVLRYQFSVGLNCVVVVFGVPGSSVGAEEGVVVHTGPPQVLTGLGTGQSQRYLTVLGLPLENAFWVLLCSISFNLIIFKVASLCCLQ